MEAVRVIDQTTFYTPETPRNGNCGEAAVASILGLTLEEVPRFSREGPDSFAYWESFEQFLNSLGWEVLLMSGNYQADCMYLASGPSLRGCSHMVVMRNGELWHDPHPSRQGIIRVEHVHLLVPKDPRGVKLRA